MSDSFTNYPKTKATTGKHTSLAETRKKSRREDIPNWEEYQEKMLEKEQRLLQNLTDYLRLKGEID